MNQSETQAMLTLARVRGVGPRTVGRLLDRFGTAEAALSASAAEWSGVEGISARGAADFLRDAASAETVDWAKEQLESAASADHDLLVRGTARYPALLSVLVDAPPVLWVRGSFGDRSASAVADDRALAVVGSRRCSHYGREQAERFGFLAAEAGLAVVSGGAYGIDAAAHRGALKARGRTVVVLGSGIAVPYPKDHAGLFDEVVQNGGAVISELPPETQPRAEQFLPRNRIIVGLSLGVLVVEAAIRSGALNTARRAVEEGRPAMYVPGRVDAASSAGCHKMIRHGEGALVTDLADVLEELQSGDTLMRGAAERVAVHTQLAATRLDESTDNSKSSEADVSPDATDKRSLFTEHATDESTLSTSSSLGIPPQHAVILAHLDEPRSLNELIQRSGLPAGQINAQLTMMEIQGTVKRQGGLFTTGR